MVSGCRFMASSSSIFLGDFSVSFGKIYNVNNFVAVGNMLLQLADSQAALTPSVFQTGGNAYPTGTNLNYISLNAGVEFKDVINRIVHNHIDFTNTGTMYVYGHTGGSWSTTTTNLLPIGIYDDTTNMVPVAVSNWYRGVFVAPYTSSNLNWIVPENVYTTLVDAINGSDPVPPPGFSPYVPIVTAYIYQGGDTSLRTGSQYWVDRRRGIAGTSNSGSGGGGAVSTPTLQQVLVAGAGTGGILPTGMGNPTTSDQAANKGYVDVQDAATMNVVTNLNLQKVTKVGGVASNQVTIDAANVYTNTLGGKLTVLGNSVQEGISSSGYSTGYHVEGNFTLAYGNYDHSEGDHSVAYSSASHAEGYYSVANSDYSHAEGSSTATGVGSHSEGTGLANGARSHAEGNLSQTANSDAHAEGFHTVALGGSSHSEGNASSANADNAHAEGNTTSANGFNSHSEGILSTAGGNNSHAEGNTTIAGGVDSHAEGNQAWALNPGSHAEGFQTTASGDYSHVEGDENGTTGRASHSEGFANASAGDFSHSEGSSNYVQGISAHVEGIGNSAIGNASHAAGSKASASNNFSYVWNGNSVVNYYDIAAGTFNINPVGGLNGFYIGTLNLGSILNGYATTGALNSATNTMWQNTTSLVNNATNVIWQNTTGLVYGTSNVLQGQITSLANNTTSLVNNATNTLWNSVTNRDVPYTDPLYQSIQSNNFGLVFGSNLVVTLVGSNYVVSGVIPALQSVLGAGNTATNISISIDAANAFTNTYGGLLSILGSRVQAGSNTAANGALSQAMGMNSTAVHSNTFVWSDGNTASSSTNGEFTVVATNGIRLLGGTTYTRGVQPISSNLFDLGSSTNSYRDLYIGTNSVYMGGTRVLSYSGTTSNMIVQTGMQDPSGISYAKITDVSPSLEYYTWGSLQGPYVQGAVTSCMAQVESAAVVSVSTNTFNSITNGWISNGVSINTNELPDNLAMGTLTFNLNILRTGNAAIRTMRCICSVYESDQVTLVAKYDSGVGADMMVPNTIPTPVSFVVGITNSVQIKSKGRIILIQSMAATGWDGSESVSFYSQDGYLTRTLLPGGSGTGVYTTQQSFNSLLAVSVTNGMKNVNLGTNLTVGGSVVLTQAAGGLDDGSKFHSVWVAGTNTLYIVSPTGQYTNLLMTTHN